jgi:hypothetical protein
MSCDPHFVRQRTVGIDPQPCLRERHVGRLSPEDDRVDGPTGGAHPEMGPENRRADADQSDAARRSGSVTVRWGYVSQSEGWQDGPSGPPPAGLKSGGVSRPPRTRRRRSASFRSKFPGPARRCFEPHHEQRTGILVAYVDIGQFSPLWNGPSFALFALASGGARGSGVLRGKSHGCSALRRQCWLRLRQTIVAGSRPAN